MNGWKPSNKLLRALAVTMAAFLSHAAMAAAATTWPLYVEEGGQELLDQPTITIPDPSTGHPVTVKGFYSTTGGSNDGFNSPLVAPAAPTIGGGVNRAPHAPSGSDGGVGFRTDSLDSKYVDNAGSPGPNLASNIEWVVFQLDADEWQVKKVTLCKFNDGDMIVLVGGTLTQYPSLDSFRTKSIAYLTSPGNGFVRYNFNDATATPAPGSSITIYSDLPANAPTGRYLIVGSPKSGSAGADTKADSFRIKGITAFRKTTASAGPDQTVNTCPGAATAPVALAGAGICDESRTIASCSWLRSGVEVASGSNPTIDLPIGTHAITLKVTDDQGITATDTVSITVKAGNNQAPVAVADGPEGTVPEGSLVVLDGSASHDPDLDAIGSYSWVQVDELGSPVQGGRTLDGPNPSFTAPEVGPDGATLRFRLVVADAPVGQCALESLASPEDTVAVVVSNLNHAPVAVAGPAQAANEGEKVTLDGSPSSDLDGNALTYSWEQIAGPPAVLSGADTPKPTFFAPAVPCEGGALVLALTVRDGYGGTATDEVRIDVSNVNVAPTALAGDNQLVAESATVTLEGSAADADGEATNATWTQIGGTPVDLSDVHALAPSFRAPLLDCLGNPSCEERLTFRLTVEDPCGGLGSDDVEVTVANEAHDPIAIAGTYPTSCEADRVTLDGGASSDPDGDSLTHEWRQVGVGPAVTLIPSPTDPASVSFTAPYVAVDTVLEFQLTVADGFGGTTSDVARITIKSCNTPPDCTAAKSSIAQLWPPNHALVAVSILDVVDPESNATITIRSVTQDEPTNGLGDGDTGPDAIIKGSTVLLRAERAGNGNGRVYRITFEAADAEGVCTKTVTVSVPRDMKKPVISVDDGDRASFDSTTTTP